MGLDVRLTVEQAVVLERVYYLQIEQSKALAHSPLPVLHIQVATQALSRIVQLVRGLPDGSKYAHLPLPEHVAEDKAEGHNSGGATHMPLVQRPYRQSAATLQAAPGFPMGAAAVVGADAGPEPPDDAT